MIPLISSLVILSILLILHLFVILHCRVCVKMMRAQTEWGAGDADVVMTMMELYIIRYGLVSFILHLL